MLTNLKSAASMNNSFGFNTTLCVPFFTACGMLGTSTSTSYINIYITIHMELIKISTHLVKISDHNFKRFQDCHDSTIHVQQVRNKNIEIQ